MNMAACPELADHPHRLKWNERYRRAAATFNPDSLLSQILSHNPPDGPALELASGPSGMAVTLAESGRAVTAIDLSDIALSQLGEEAARRGVSERLTLLHADLDDWQPSSADYALVMCRFFWNATLFARACAAVSRGGILAWEAPAVTDPPSSHVRAEWCLAPGEPGSLLPGDFEVLQQVDMSRGTEVVRRMVARRQPV
jgi:hypothetical protein